MGRVSVSVSSEVKEDIQEAVEDSNDHGSIRQFLDVAARHEIQNNSTNKERLHKPESTLSKLEEELRKITV